MSLVWVVHLQTFVSLSALFDILVSALPPQTFVKFKCSM